MSSVILQSQYKELRLWNHMGISSKSRKIIHRFDPTIIGLADRPLVMIGNTLGLPVTQVKALQSNQPMKASLSSPLMCYYL